MTTVSIYPSPASFPVSELISSGIWSAMSPAARAVFVVIWDFHRQFPDTCHPNRSTISRLAGVSEPTVTRTLKELIGMGLLHVIPAAGLGPNTYRIDWQDIEIPEKASSKKNNPYKQPSREFTFYMGEDENGNERIVHQKTSHHYKMPDQCVLRSAAEVAIHAWLVAWQIPHWANVPYSTLKIFGLHKEATVDFIVAPKMLIEVFGLPRTQRQVIKYNRNRQKKEELIRKAGWQLMAIEPGEQFADRHFEPIMNAWANASLEDAKNLSELLKNTPFWRKGMPSCQMMADLYKNAVDRNAGKIPPDFPQGMFKDTLFNGMPATVRTEPRLVLGSHLGRNNP